MIAKTGSEDNDTCEGEGLVQESGEVCSPFYSA